MSEDFKVGDHVRCTHTKQSCISVGQIYEITNKYEVGFVGFRCERGAHCIIGGDGSAFERVYYSKDIKQYLVDTGNKVQSTRDNLLFDEAFDDIKNHPETEQHLGVALSYLDLAARFLKLAALAIK